MLRIRTKIVRVVILLIELEIVYNLIVLIYEFPIRLDFIKFYFDFHFQYKLRSNATSLCSLSYFEYDN